MFPLTLWRIVRQASLCERWSRLFASSREVPGWAAPAGLLASAVSLVIVGPLVGGVAIKFFLFGCAICFVACLSLTCRAAQSLWRVGMRGWRLAHWWFEIASISWIIFLFAFISGTSLVLL